MNSRQTLNALRSRNPKQKPASLEKPGVGGPRLPGQTEDLTRFSWKLRQIVDSSAPAASAPETDKMLQRPPAGRRELQIRTPAGPGTENRMALDRRHPGAPSGETISSGRRRRHPVLGVLARAAAVVLLALPPAWWLHRELSRHRDPAASGPVLAPRGLTGMTQPTLVWENEPGQAYHVWILPGGSRRWTAPALFLAENVRSPVPFSRLRPGPSASGKLQELVPGSRYLALIRPAGQSRLAGVAVPFETTLAAQGAPPVPADAETALSLARQMQREGRPGDALMVLSSLPAPLHRQHEIMALEADLRGQ